MKHSTLLDQSSTSFLTRSRPICSPLGLIALGLTILLILGISIPAAHAQTYSEQPVHSFSNNNPNGDGVSPFGTLITINGILYGTTSRGGTNDDGTVFSLDPKTEVKTTLHSFSGSDGANVPAGLINVGGILYGTTAGGGANNCGTVFSINPDGTGFQTLYRFLGKPGDGAYPVANLLNINGILYGTTYGGGTNDDGTVFSINPTSGAEKTLYSFGSATSDGQKPEASLVEVNGVLYGTTIQGGAHYAGTIFSMNLDGTNEQVLYTCMLNSADASFPSSGMINVNGILYGTSGGGGDTGTIFSFDPVSHQLTTLYRFTAIDVHADNSDGAAPFDNLLDVNGTLYGTTFDGGVSGRGTVFSYNLATNKETTIHAFTDARGEGAECRGGLVNIGDAFYGTAAEGGDGGGAVFSLTPKAETPVANDDTYTPKDNTPYAVKAPGFLANDFAGGSPITVTLMQAPLAGTLVYQNDGSFVYTPRPGFLGADFFFYRITNANYSSRIATVTLNVQQAVPVAHNDVYTPKYATAYAVKAPGVLANDYNFDSNTLSAGLVTGPSHGTVTLNDDGSFVYTPAAGFVGSDSFTYQAWNGVGHSSPATVSLKVQTSIPAAHNDTYTPRLNTAYNVSAAKGVLTNDYAGDNGTLTATLVASTTHGTLTFNSDGSFRYTPSNGFTGADTFTYKDTNTVGASSTATVTLTVQ